MHINVCSSRIYIPFTFSIAMMSIIACLSTNSLFYYVTPRPQSGRFQFFLAYTLTCVSVVKYVKEIM